MCSVYWMFLYREFQVLLYLAYTMARFWLRDVLNLTVPHPSWVLQLSLLWIHQVVLEGNDYKIVMGCGLYRSSLATMDL